MMYRVPTFVLLALSTCVVASCHARRLVPRPLAVDHFVDNGSATLPASSIEETPNGPHVVERALALWNERLENHSDWAFATFVGAPADSAMQQVAQEPSFPASLSNPIDENVMLTAAWMRNPAIAAAREKLEATKNRYAQVSYLDAIIGQYASFQRSSMTKIGMPLSGDRLDQHFPFPGTLELKAALVGHSMEEARARYVGTTHRVLTEARIGFAKLIYVGQAIQILRHMAAYTKQLEAVARSRFESGIGKKGAVLQAQVEIANFDNRVETLERDGRILAADLKRHMHVPLESTLGEPTPSSVPQIESNASIYIRASLVTQPKIREAHARLARMETMIALGELGTYPAFSIGLSEMAGVSHATGGSERAKQPFDVRPKIKPDPWFGTKDAYLREMRDSLSAAKNALAAVRDETQFRVQQAHSNFQTASRLRDLYHDVQLKQAQQVYEDASASYATGGASPLDVFDALRRLLRFRLDAARALRDLHIAHAHLILAVGRQGTE